MQKSILPIIITIIVLVIAVAIALLSYRYYQTDITIPYIPTAIDTGSISSGSIDPVVPIVENTGVIQTGSIDIPSVVLPISTVGSLTGVGLPIDISPIDVRTGAATPPPRYILCSPDTSDQSLEGQECQGLMRESMDRIERDQALWIHTGTWVQTETGIVSTSSISSGSQP